MKLAKGMNDMFNYPFLYAKQKLTQVGEINPIFFPKTFNPNRGPEGTDRENLYPCPFSGFKRFNRGIIT